MKRWLTTGWLVLAAAVIGGCSWHPLVPPSALAPTQTATAKARPSIPVSIGGPAPTGPPVLGVDLYSSNRFTPALVSSDGRRDLAYMRRVLGAQSVGIVWNLYSPSLTSSTIRSTDISLTPAEVATLTRQARRLGMTVEYRPLIRVGRSWQWEGHISPVHPRAWFASLYRSELPYLKVAQRLHVDAFVVGTELHGLFGSALWPGFLTRVHAVYDGVTTSSAWQYDYYSHPGSLPPTALLGLDPYPHADLPATATVSQLVGAWDQDFSQVPAAVLSRTAMQEVGIPAQVGAYLHPEVWGKPGKPDELVQARWFTAACDVVRQYHMRGIYFYEVNLTEDPANPLPFSAFFEGKQGASAIRGCRKTFRA
jgi:Glycoside Hydrolase Family 113